MQTLEKAKIKQTYLIKSVEATGSLHKHLDDLGLIVGAKIALITINKDNGIVLLHNSRLALDREILRLIEIMDTEEDEETWEPLNVLRVGESGKVVGIHGTGEVKRRLMDMGITRGVQVHIRKTAPLGDPIEINLRGYELTLRKSEAELILVSPIRVEEKA
ncbi:MAG: ferrous iron transport protein A [Lactobacillales bacterium]|jgi:ferrous iron transport protein A|nr:ferrous iron transport protein A [Lactobacillales bacterium]